jgi:hypothetical protein
MITAISLVAQFIAVCSSSILAETLGYAASFSSPWREKRQQFPPMRPMSYVTMMSEESAGDLTSIWL